MTPTAKDGACAVTIRLRRRVCRSSYAPGSAYGSHWWPVAVAGPLPLFLDLASHPGASWRLLNAAQSWRSQKRHARSVDRQELSQLRSIMIGKRGRTKVAETL